MKVTQALIASLSFHTLSIMTGSCHLKAQRKKIKNQFRDENDSGTTSFLLSAKVLRGSDDVIARISV